MKISIKDITLIGMMVAVIEVCKIALSFLPNIELVSFWIIMFTLFFRKRVALVLPVFVTIEGALYGFGMWWIAYLYIWPILAIITHIFRKNDSVWFWSILSGTFGLFFGMLSAVPYVFMGAVGGSIMSGLKAGFAWWVSGIPWDVVHCIGNFCLMLALYRPVRNVLRKVNLFNN